MAVCGFLLLLLVLEKLRVRQQRPAVATTISRMRRTQGLSCVIIAWCSVFCFGLLGFLLPHHFCDCLLQDLLDNVGPFSRAFEKFILRRYQLCRSEVSVARTHRQERQKEDGTALTCLSM